MKEIMIKKKTKIQILEEIFKNDVNEVLKRK